MTRLDQSALDGLGPSDAIEQLAIASHLLGRGVAFYRRLVDVTGSVKAALMLSQAIYWARHGRDIETARGWFMKTAKQWALETGLSEREQASARAVLRDIVGPERRATRKALPTSDASGASDQGPGSTANSTPDLHYAQVTDPSGFDDATNFARCVQEPQHPNPHSRTSGSSNTSFTWTPYSRRLTRAQRVSTHLVLRVAARARARPEKPTPNSNLHASTDACTLHGRCS